MKKLTLQQVKNCELDILIALTNYCEKHNLRYYLAYGTLLGAVRHGGFIPWDDDLDIFMTPKEYKKFKEAVESDKNQKFVLQEWSTVKGYLEYAKLRMNGTTLIEENFKDRKDMHHGIYVDIMILHKVSELKIIQKLVYYESKFVTLYALSQRNWKPKSIIQTIILNLLKLLPCQLIAKICYHHIYKYDDRTDNFKYCYWITPAKFHSGLFDKSFFETPIDIPFEDTVLYGSKNIKEYLKYRYGDYMKLPSKEQQRAAVHALIFDTEKDYSEYFK